MRDITLEETVYFNFTTRAFTTGVPTVLAGTPVLSVLESNNATPITAGVSVSVDRASVVGLNQATVVATAANGYEAGKSYAVYISAGTVGGVSVIGEVVAEFTIQSSAAFTKLPALPASTTNITAGTITTATNVTTVNGLAAGVITATSIAADAITDAKVASDVTIASVTGSVGSVTGLTASDVGAIKTKTDFLPSATAGAAGGLFIAGSNAATTYASLTVTGLTTHTGNMIFSDGITVSAPSTADRPGVKINGSVGGSGGAAGVEINGGPNGPGMLLVGGSTTGSALLAYSNSGDGVQIAATTGNYSGISFIGSGSSPGALFTGGITGPGVKFTGGTTSGNGAEISTTDGHGISVTASGSSKHGMVLTGGTGGTSDGLKAVAGTGGVPIRGSITGDLSGSVGSVTGLTNATIADQVWDEVLSGHLTAGSTGNALNAAGAAGDPWTTSLPGAYGAGSAGYIIGNNVDALISSRLAPTTAGRTLDVSATGEAGIDWANIGSPSTSVNLSATNIDVDQVVASVSGAVGSVSGLTSAAISDAVWDEVLSGHLTGGSTGNALNAAGAAGDPWSTALPGAYSAGTAGKIIGDNINATISSRATQTSVDTIDGIVDDILIDTAEIGTAGAGLTNINLPNQTMDIVGNITGNISGSVGAVTGLTVANLDVASSTLATAANLATVAGYLDTEIAAIKAKTDNLPASPAAVGDIPTTAAIADQVWDEAIAGHLTAGSTGEALDAASSGGDPWGTALPGAYGAGTAGQIIGDYLNAPIGDVPTATENADALLNRDMSLVSDTNARTPLNALRAMRNKSSIVADVLTVTKEDDATTAWTAATTPAPGADPISAIDPT